MTFDPFLLERLRISLKEILLRLQQRFPHLMVHGALLDTKGDLLDAQGSNAIHLASFEPLVKAAKKYLQVKINETIITNDPGSGSPRLCDLTLIQGAFGKNQANELRYYVALQLSLPGLLNKKVDGLALSVEDEGFRIPPTPLEAGGGLNQEIVSYLCLTQIDRSLLTDALNIARVGLKHATQELISLEATLGREIFGQGLTELKNYSDRAMRKALHEIPDGEYTASDTFDSDGTGAQNLQIQCQLTVQGENILLSFVGTAKQTKGPFNCSYTVTLGACFWVFRSLVKLDIPTNTGALNAFSIEAPEGTLINARYPAPLLGGYYETSRRIIDTLFTLLLKALPTELPAQNGGSAMATLIQSEKGFFLEELSAGAGGTKTLPGVSGVTAELENRSHVSLEEFEKLNAIELVHSTFREKSGGDGKNGGGRGISRGYRFLSPAKVVLLFDRQDHKPKGLFGGTLGTGSEAHVIRNGAKKKEPLLKGAYSFNVGDVLVLNSPGGGAWGKTPEEKVEAETLEEV